MSNIEDLLGKFIQECSDYYDLNQASDLEIVVIGASLIDSALEYRIKSELRPGNTSEALLCHTGLLGSNAAKIKVLYAFNKIDKELMIDCEIIAGIRNKFAHRRNCQDLELIEHRKGIEKLKIFGEKYECLGVNKNAISGEISFNLVFTNACVLISLALAKATLEKIKDINFAKIVAETINKNCT
jgi:hypothetical protein